MYNSPSNSRQLNQLCSSVKHCKQDHLRAGLGAGAVLAAHSLTFDSTPITDVQKIKLVPKN